MGLFDAIASLFTTGATNRSNRRIARQTNEFNAQQSELNRQFQSQEAQIARDWQESQYLQYSSPSAMVQQYEDAGLNPALMYGSNLQSGTGSSPYPSGSQAQGTAIPMQTPSFSGIMEDIVALSKVKAEIDNIRADTESKRAGTTKTLSDIEVNKQSIAESQQRASKLIEETKNEKLRGGYIIAQTMLAEADKDLKHAQSISLSYDNLRKEFNQRYVEKFGFYPSNSVIESALQIFGQGVAEIEHFGGKSINFVKNLFK